MWSLDHAIGITWGLASTANSWDLQNQKLWRRDPVTCILTSSLDAVALYSLRTSGVEENLELPTEEQMSLVIQEQDRSEDQGELWVLFSSGGWAFILSFLPTLR